jgi:hypothetical protein
MATLRSFAILLGKCWLNFVLVEVIHLNALPLYVIINMLA